MTLSLNPLAVPSPMPDRYYSEVAISGDRVTLEGSEAHHLLHVMRAQPGLEVIVFDGQGGEFLGEVVACGRSEVEVAVGSRLPVERELPWELTVAVALPKGDRQRWLVEKCVELGVARLVPLQTERSVGKSEASHKLDRYVIEASKQCGRNRLMEITPAASWTQYLSDTQSPVRLLAHPGGQSINDLRAQLTAQQAVVVAIGPEGGFTDEEVLQAAQAGWQTVGLGPRLLRIETAAVALVSALTLE